jgi:hypothetical protein
MEFYIIILSATIGALAFELSKRISDKNNTIPLTPVNAKNKETGEDIVLVPIDSLTDADGIKMPIGLSTDFEIEDIEYNNSINADFDFNIVSIKGVDTKETHNYIKEINWQFVINATINEVPYTEHIDKTTIFPNSIGEDFIPYEQITKEDLIEWVSKNININILKQKLEAKVIAKSNSFPIKPLDLPYIVKDKTILEEYQIEE